MKRVLKHIQQLWKKIIRHENTVTDRWAYVTKNKEEETKKKNKFLNSFAYFANPRNYKGKFYKFIVVGPLFFFNLPTHNQTYRDIAFSTFLWYV